MQVVDVIVGGQYGSEAKGHVTAQIVKQSVQESLSVGGTIKVINVRVAGPNAGHTVYDANGEKFAFRSLPVGAVVDESVVLYIAPGSEIDVSVLMGEIALAESAGHSVKERLYVSRQATVIENWHKTWEVGLVDAVGSTGKGIGAARAARLMREAMTIGQMYGDEQTPWEWAEPEDLYATDSIVHDEQTHVIIEGTQGYGLSLRASGHYPQVTSSDARSVDFLAMAGIDPTRCSVQVNNWVVCRVFPIRVAGNSGPMKGETTWEDLGLEAEKTTVTQKVRRVGEWDQDLVRRAVQANGGHTAKVVITMLDQVVPELRGIPAVESDEDILEYKEAFDKGIDWLNEHATYQQLGATVAAFTYGPREILWTRDENQAGPDLEAIKRSVIEELLGGEVNTDGER